MTRQNKTTHTVSGMYHLTTKVLPRELYRPNDRMIIHSMRFFLVKPRSIKFLKQSTVNISVLPLLR